MKKLLQNLISNWNTLYDGGGLIIDQDLLLWEGSLSE